ncbi:MAG: hypothetical protein RRX88_05025 [Raoultibacter sp.]
MTNSHHCFNEVKAVTNGKEGSLSDSLNSVYVTVLKDLSSGNAGFVVAGG